MLCSMTISFIGYDHSHAFIEFVLHRLSFKFVFTTGPIQIIMVLSFINIYIA